MYVVDCDQLSRIQTVTISFGNLGSIRLPGNQIGITSSGNICVSIFQNGGSDISILGAWFLRSYYTAFDYANARIGFATAIKVLANGTAVAPEPILRVPDQKGAHLVFRPILASLYP
jgi:hypothetical protein